MYLLVVDDERPARDKLRRLLTAMAPVTRVETAADAFDALAVIERDPPDAVLLDIAMPEIDGLELAASLPQPAPLIVFVTAWDHHALAAFELASVDYILKPYDAERLHRCVERLAQRLRERDAVGQGPAGQALPGRALQRLLITERGVSRVVAIDDIEWIETADNYVALHLVGERAGDTAPLLRQSLAALLDQLGERFVRCHRRVAVQPARVVRLAGNDKGDGEIVLASGAVVPCSRNHRAEVLARLGQTAKSARPAG